MRDFMFIPSASSIISRLVFGLEDVLLFIVLLMSRKNDGLILVAAHSASFNGNSYAFWLGAQKEKRWKTIASVRNDAEWRKIKRESRYCVRRNSTLYRWIARRADVLVFSCFISYDFGPEFVTSKAIKLNLWHGTPVKGIGLQCYPVPAIVAGTDYAISTSPFTQAIISRAMGVPVDNVWITGEPKTDLLNRGSSFQSFDNKYKILISYFPTWREELSSSGSENVPSPGRMRAVIDHVVGSIALRDWLLENKAAFVIRLHPLHARPDDVLPPPFFYQNTTPWTNHLTAEDLIIASHVVISDYSGVLTDALFARKALLVYAPDIREYDQQRGFPYYDFMEIWGGVASVSADELRNALEGLKENKWEFTSEHTRLDELFISCRDGSASLRIIERLNQIKRFEGEGLK